MKRVYVDTEFIYDGMFYERRPSESTDKKEIIQIAAVLFDHNTGTELRHLDILVKPIFHEILPEFFIELTGINDDMILNKAVPFKEALDTFVNFCEDFPIWTFNSDYDVFLQNLEFNSLQNPFKEPFRKVKPNLEQFGIDPNSFSSGTLYKAVNLDLKGHVHYALHDVRSMSQAVHVLLQKPNHQSLL